MKTTCYLQLRPDFWAGGTLRRIRAARVTNLPPDPPLPGVVTVKLQIEAPDHLFQPLEASVVVTEAGPGELEITAEELP